MSTGEPVLKHEVVANPDVRSVVRPGTECLTDSAWEDYRCNRHNSAVTPRKVVWQYDLQHPPRAPMATEGA